MQICKSVTLLDITLQIVQEARGSEDLEPIATTDRQREHR